MSEPQPNPYRPRQVCSKCGSKNLNGPLYRCELDMGTNRGAAWIEVSCRDCVHVSIKRLDDPEPQPTEAVESNND